MSGIKLHFWQL